MNKSDGVSPCGVYQLARNGNHLDSFNVGRDSVLETKSRPVVLKSVFAFVVRCCGLVFKSRKNLTDTHLSGLRSRPFRVYSVFQLAVGTVWWAISGDSKGRYPGPW